MGTRNSARISRHLIDYAGLSSSRDPESSASVPRRGKFVLILSAGHTYLALARIGAAPLHADIVEMFCQDRGIAGSMNEGGARFEIEDPAWSVAGGGGWTLDTASKRIKLANGSAAYGKCDFGQLKDLLAGIGGRIGDFAFTLPVQDPAA